MDTRKQPVLVVLALFMVVKHIIVGMLLQQLVMYQQSVEIMMMVVFKKN